MRCIASGVHLCRVMVELGMVDIARLLMGTLRSRTALAAENLFLRKQLALYRERQVKPRRASDSLQLTLVLLALVRVVGGAHDCSARHAPPLAPRGLPTLVALALSARTAAAPGGGAAPDRRHGPGQSHVGGGADAAELLLKLGLCVSPRTVRRSMVRGNRGGGRRATGPRWATFVRNHAQALVACDFCVVVTATFRILYVFVALEVGSRRFLHINATAHPTARWTLEQFREILAEPHAYRCVLHDRDSIYAPWRDAAGTAMGVRILRTPVQAPVANAVCERLLGTLRRECLDFLIPLGEEHLQRALRIWQVHYNRARPHSRLGPCLPQPPPGLPAVMIAGHPLPRDRRVVARSILGGLHHEYSFEGIAA